MTGTEIAAKTVGNFPLNPTYEDYPNPFNPETWIPYHLANACNAQISIYDINSVLVRQLNLGYQRAGYYTDRSRAVYWDSGYGRGARVVSGVYFFTLATEISCQRIRC